MLCLDAVCVMSVMLCLDAAVFAVLGPKHASSRLVCCAVVQVPTQLWHRLCLSTGCCVGLMSV
jgi:hypothetical protein